MIDNHPLTTGCTSLGCSVHMPRVGLVALFWSMESKTDVELWSWNFFCFNSKETRSPYEWIVPWISFWKSKHSYLKSKRYSFVQTLMQINMWNLEIVLWSLFSKDACSQTKVLLVRHLQITIYVKVRNRWVDKKNHSTYILSHKNEWGRD